MEFQARDMVGPTRIEPHLAPVRLGSAKSCHHASCGTSLYACRSFERTTPLGDKVFKFKPDFSEEAKTPRLVERAYPSDDRWWWQALSNDATFGVATLEAPRRVFPFQR